MWLCFGGYNRYIKIILVKYFGVLLRKYKGVDFLWREFYFDRYISTQESGKWRYISKWIQGRVKMNKYIIIGYTSEVFSN